MRLAQTYSTLMLAGVICLVTGCEKKERIIDIKTPHVDVEVNKTNDGIEIETERKGHRDVEVKVPGAEVEVEKR